MNAVTLAATVAVVTRKTMTSQPRRNTAQWRMARVVTDLKHLKKTLSITLRMSVVTLSALDGDETQGMAVHPG